MQFDFNAAKRSAPTLDNYEGDLLGLFGNYAGSNSVLDAKFDPNLSDFFDASVDQCARMCFMASGWYFYRVTHHFDSNLPLTSKQKLRFSLARPGQARPKLLF